MANNASAEKRIRQTRARTERNQAVKSRVRSSRKKVLALVESGDASGAAEALKQFSAEVDRAAKTGVFHKNQASRRKSRLAKMVAAGK